MIRNLKVLGLALCTVFAFSAVATSAASASIKTDHFTAPVGTTHLTGIQTGAPSENVFGTKGSALAVNCTGATYTGTLTAASSEQLTTTPAFTGCTAFGAASPVDVNGCKFILTGTTHTSFNTNKVHNGEEATVHLDCGDNAANNIKVTGLGGCTITFEDTHAAGVKVNQNLLGVRYTNGSNSTGVGLPTHWDFEIDVTVDDITYTTTPQCAGFGLPATGKDGFLTEKVTVKGYSDAAHTKQVSVTVT